MTGMAARHRRAGATRLTARICDHASSDNSVTGPSFVPGSTALLTSTVSVPNRSTAASTSSAALASRARSAGTKTASPSMPSITRPPRSESRPVTTTRAPPVGRQLVDQLLAPAHGERAGDADVVEVAVRVVEPEQQRPDDPAALVPAEPGDDAVGRALVLDLDHHPLVLAVVDVLPLDDNTVESGALETIEPVARDTRIGGEWRQVDRRLEGLADLLQVRPPI